MSFSVVIPARFASTRLPGKPLVDIGGKPMIQHVYERVLESGAERVTIATDDERIRAAAEAFGADVRMTSDRHRSGTERIAEVVTALNEPDDGIVVNIQVDEPYLPPALVAQVAENLAQHPQADVATLCNPITEDAALFDPGVVKVVCDRSGYALYFSRAPIPWYRDDFAEHPGSRPPNARHFEHVGLYAYRVSFLKTYADLPVCEIEQAEALEQLRVLFHGGRIHVGLAAQPPGPGVDTPEDLERVRQMARE